VEYRDFRRLLTPEGQQALQAAQELSPREVDFLAHFTSLSRSYPPGLARAALETAILRSRASLKFPKAGKMYFTRQALEQASAYPVASYCARRFAGFDYLADLGCSIGGDTLALAEQAFTIGVDMDRLRLAMAQANMQAAGLENRTFFVQADLAQPLPFAGLPGLGLFFDPARRSQGRRLHSVREYRPPLDIIRGWPPALAVKISPGVRMDELAAYDAEVEFISLHGELKEALLWFGPLKTVHRRATVLPGPHSLSTTEPGLAAGDLEETPKRLVEPRAYLYEPDPSVLRAGLVALLAERIGARQMDADIAYLTADRLVDTPFARIWAIEDWFPFNLKKLRQALRSRQVGRVVVKKRGSPLQPDALIHKLRLKGDQERVVFLTHLRGSPIVILSPGEVKPS
jgi:hypothetical protein